MADILNLDEIETGLEKTIKLDGKNHDMQPMSVQHYIDYLKQLETLKDADPTEAFEVMVKTTLVAFPTLTEEQVRGLTLRKINAITAFIQAETEEETTEGNA